jgi:hypothetical protein
LSLFAVTNGSLPPARTLAFQVFCMGVPHL